MWGFYFNFFQLFVHATKFIMIEMVNEWKMDRNTFPTKYRIVLRLRSSSDFPPSHNSNLGMHLNKDFVLLQF